MEGLIFGWASVRRGSSTEENLHFQIDWASLIVGSNFTVFALFYFVFESNFRVQPTGVAYIWWGALTESFLSYRFGRLIYLEGLVHGGAFFRNFTVYQYTIPPVKYSFLKRKKAVTSAATSAKLSYFTFKNGQ